MVDDDESVGYLIRFPQGGLLMHDFIIALAFVGLLITPAIVAARAGKNQAE